MKNVFKGEFDLAFTHLRNNQTISAYNEFLRLAEKIKEESNLHSALLYMLAAECKNQQKKENDDEFKESAEQFLKFASKNKGYDSKYSYVCASKCFLRVAEYDKAEDAFEKSKKIKIILKSTPKPIVIVEDSQAMTLRINAFLKTLGYSELFTFHLGNDALQETINLIKKNKNSIVLLDMGLPDTTGDVIASKLLEFKVDLPIILITADEKSSERVHSTISQGATAFIQKPFTIDDLKKALDKVEAEEIILKKH